MAGNTTTPPKFAKPPGSDPPTGLMSAMSVVPAIVPLLDHSSLPFATSFAAKSTSAPWTKNSVGNDETMPGAMSRSNCVPAAVPSDVHSS